VSATIVRRSSLPGFGLTMGLTLTWLSLIVLIPLAALFLKTTELTLDRFVRIVTSPRVVRHFAELFGADWERRRPELYAASIGPVTSGTLRELQLPVGIEAREFTMGGLIRAIVLARYAVLAR